MNKKTFQFGEWSAFTDLNMNWLIGNVHIVRDIVKLVQRFQCFPKRNEMN